MNSLEIDSVLANYDGRTILQDIYLKCDQNEIVGLLGRNGCGKSTLLKIIFGSLQPEHKTLRINQQWVPQGYRNQKVTMLPQSGMIPPGISLQRALDLFQIKTDIIKTYAPQLITLLNHRPDQLSGGELRLIELLLILFCRSQFCLLDEPFSGMSPVTIEHVIEIMTDVKKTKGILITDHLHRYITSCSDRMYVMISGRIQQISNASELVELGYLNNE